MAEKKGRTRAPLALAMAIGMGGSLRVLPPAKERKVKKCLACSKEHTHNNSFCSAECCKKYKG